MVDKKSVKKLAVKIFLFTMVYFFFFVFSILIQIPSVLGIGEIRSILIGALTLLVIESLKGLENE
jgi:hypothetical protein